MSYTSFIEVHLHEHQQVIQELVAQSSGIETMAEMWISALRRGGKILFFGNGGSAADAQHLAAELVVRYRQNRQALAGLALTTDTSVLTAGANDFGFETIYARQVEALARPEDLVIGISTSGNSRNVVLGLEAAKKLGCKTLAFTAKDGGECSKITDYTFQAPSKVTARAQECHLLVGHILCDLVEEAFKEA